MRKVWIFILETFLFADVVLNSEYLDAMVELVFRYFIEV